MKHSNRTWRITGWHVYVTATILSLAVCALVASTLYEARQESWNRASQSAQNLSHAIADEIGRSIQSLALSLQAVADNSQVPGVLDLPSRLRDMTLFDRSAAASDIGYIALLDRGGNAVASVSAGQPVTVDFSDVSFWKQHHDSADLGVLVSGAFRGSVRPELVFTVSRRVPDQNGGFGGLALGTIRLDAIRARFEAAHLSPNDSMALFHKNGTLMMRVPYKDNFIGSYIGDNPTFRKAIEGGDGAMVAVSALDDVRKLFVFCPVPGTPLHVAVTLSVDSLESGWRRQAMWVGLATLILVLALFGASHLLCQEFRRRQRIEAALSESEAEFRLLAEYSSDMVSRIGPDNIRRYVSPASLHLLGLKPDALVGRRPQEKIHPDDQATVEAAVGPLRRGEAEEARLSYRCQREDGRWIWLEAALKVVHDPVTGQRDGIVAITRDVTERKSLEETLAQLASLDGLTGVANRRIFDESLQREWHRGLRGKLPLSLLLVDVDRFKALNDSQGHPKGDDCLRRIAALLRTTIRRGSDLVARYGGEEFTLLLPETDAAGAEAVGERLRAEIEALALPHAAGGLGGVVTVSVGAATIWPSGSDTDVQPRDLVEAADRSLYRAKQTGRNRVVHNMLLACET
jgi:diguanylate cyclase (GGDEF)-like protein/PAS domain S-box-containing protein